MGPPLFRQQAGAARRWSCSDQLPSRAASQSQPSVGPGRRTLARTLEELMAVVQTRLLGDLADRQHGWAQSGSRPTRQVITGDASGAGEVMSRQSRPPSSASSRSKNPQQADSRRTRSEAAERASLPSHSRAPPAMSSAPWPWSARSCSHSAARSPAAAPAPRSRRGTRPDG